jgi:hypothetical protein
MKLFDIVERDGLYQVLVGGEIDETFYSLADAQDYLVCLMHERDMAFADI